LTANYSYSYWGHVILGSWFVAVSDVDLIGRTFSQNGQPLRLLSGWNSTYTFTLSDGSSATTQPLKEGIERFFVTDINNPAGSSQAQSNIPVMWDTAITNSSVGTPAEWQQILHGDPTDAEPASCEHWESVPVGVSCLGGNSLVD
jgi:hypothetical protein